MNLICGRFTYSLHIFFFFFKKKVEFRRLVYFYPLKVTSPNVPSAQKLKNGQIQSAGKQEVLFAIKTKQQYQQEFHQLVRRINYFLLHVQQSLNLLPTQKDTKNFFFRNTSYMYSRKRLVHMMYFVYSVWVFIGFDHFFLYQARVRCCMVVVVCDVTRLYY